MTSGSTTTVRESYAAWSAFLDDLEAEVRHAAGADGSGRAPAFVPPDDLGPLPRELADRAQLVLAAITEASGRVRDAMDRSAEQLHELHQHDPRGPKPASSFDERA